MCKMITWWALLQLITMIDFFKKVGCFSLEIWNLIYVPICMVKLNLGCLEHSTRKKQTLWVCWFLRDSRLGARFWNLWTRPNGFVYGRLQCIHFKCFAMCRRVRLAKYPTRLRKCNCLIGWVQAPRRPCCEVIHGSGAAHGVVQLQIRGCGGSESLILPQEYE